MAELYKVRTSTGRANYSLGTIVLLTRQKQE